jgi:chorismate synthase
MRPNTACAIIAAADARRRARPATRVAAGAIARKILPDVKVRGALVQMGPHKIDRDKWDWDEIARNPFFCPDKDKAAFFEQYLDGIRKSGSSIGAVIEVVAEGVPAGLGRADLRQARRRAGGGDDEHQRGEGRRDRRGFGAAELSARKTPTRCAPATTARGFCPTMPAACSAASRPASRWWCALR